MSVINADRQEAESVEGEIHEFVRRDARRQQLESSEIAANNINSLVQRVAGSSLLEIDNLVGQLQSLREFLVQEGERVQREIANYGELSKATLRSTKIISESVAQWKRGPEREI